MRGSSASVSLPDAHSFLEVTPANVMLSSLRLVEPTTPGAGPEWEVRLYETAGAASQVALRLDRPVKDVRATNFLGEPAREATKIETVGNVEQWSANNLDIFVGDIFELSGKMLGQVDAVYDRAALVAFPADLRTRYSAHLMEMTDKAPQFLICYEYDQSLMEGPPFSVSDEEVHLHYATTYDLTLIASTQVAGGLKGKALAKENVWLLKR